MFQQSFRRKKVEREIPDVEQTWSLREKYERSPGYIERFSRYIPILHWLPVYAQHWRRWIGRDISAGLTTASLLVPQALAYGELAGLDPIMGLYSSFVSGLLYAPLGTCREMSVGK